MTPGMSVTQLTPITPSAQGTDPCLEDSTGHQSHARLQIWRETRHKLPNGRRNMFAFWQNYYIATVGSRKCYIFCLFWIFFLIVSYFQ